MQFILLIFINIVMGAIFYLILRLKLERYASDYREKRLKREMDEIICEFNETAERNITLLESRIDYLKKILEKTSTLNRVDVKIDNNLDDIINIHSNEMSISNDISNENSGERIENKHKKNNYLNEFYSQIKNKFNNAIRSISYLHNKNNNPPILEKDSEMSNTNIVNISGQKKEIIDIVIKEKEKNQGLNDNESPENDLEEMFRTAEDKYSLISELYNKGYSADLICRSSGIPIGEIKLVLDLNNSL